MRFGLLTAIVGFVALLAPSLATAGPGLVVGAVDDDVRATTLVDAEAKMTAFRLAGFRAVRIESFWMPGDTRPSDSELQIHPQRRRRG